MTTRTPPPAGTYGWVASYAGNSSYTFTTATELITINRAATVSALTANPTTVTHPNPVTLTATVSSTAGTPTGNVTFYDGAKVLGAVALSGTAGHDIATYIVSSTTVGTHNYTAVYDDAPNFAASTSNVATVTVN